MKIIYVSTLISKTKMNDIIKNSKNKPLQSIQKYHRLICEGFVKNSIQVKTISCIPMSRMISKKIFWIDKKEEENGVKYSYIPFINIKIIRQMCMLLGTMLKVLREACRNKKDKIFICDILNTTISTTTLFLCKILNIKCWAIITDLPRDMPKNRYINEKMQNKYDGYILITEAMNKIVNPKGKPHIVIEGIVNSDNFNGKDIVKRENKKILFYAGGLYEKYGIMMLIEAFSKIKREDIELHIYGTGELDEKIKQCKDNRIKLFGVVTNDVIVSEEKKATILINPRYTNEEYTKYSFPSKNIEYMSSGTPILTTKLPGIPKEYYDYVYTIDNETVDGMKNIIEKLLNLPEEQLKEKGIIAKKFVFKYKNNIEQTKKIIKLMGRV